MTNFNYQVIHSARRSISIIVNPDKGVVVRAPCGASRNDIDRLVLEKTSWIEKQIRKFSELNRICHKEFKDGESYPLLGREMILRTILSDKLYVRSSDGYIEAGVNNTDDARLIKLMLEGWYRRIAHEVFSSRLYQILDKYRHIGFSPSGLSVRELKSRWGSCNSKGKIILNVHLVKLSESYIDYVITHELCHLKHHNHGKEFYRLLGELVPDYRSIRKELKKYLTQ